jgi:hypothetical protein
MPVHEGDPPASIKSLAHTELADVYSLRKDGAPINVISNQSHPVDTTPNFTVSSTLTAERRYFCSCGRDYSQPQGVLRHRRAAHKKLNPCFSPPCKFKWTRPCEYRTHIERRHTSVNPDKILGKPAGYRCRSTIIGRDPLQRLPSLLLIKSSDEPGDGRYAKVTHVMSPVARDPQSDSDSDCSTLSTLVT